MALLVVSITGALFVVSCLALLLVFGGVGGGAGLLVRGLTLLLVLGPVGLLTHRLVGGVALLLVVSLINRLIHCVTRLLIGGGALGLIGCLIDGLVMGLIHCSAFWSISVTGQAQTHRSYHKLKRQKDKI